MLHYGVELLLGGGQIDPGDPGGRDGGGRSGTGARGTNLSLAYELGGGGLEAAALPAEFRGGPPGPGLPDAEFLPVA